MDAKDKAASVLVLAAIWEDVEPVFLEEVLSSVQLLSSKQAGMDPLESIVRSRVLAQIGTVPIPGRVDVKKRYLFSDFIQRWARSPYVRMTAAAVLIVAIVWILSIPILTPGPGSTTAATTMAGTTAAGITTAATTYAGTTAAATTAAAGTTAATTQAATTRVGTTATTTITPSGTSQPIPVVWPAHLIKYLGFDLSQVNSAGVRRYQENGLLERSGYVADQKSLNQIVDLVNQIYLEKPATQDPPSAKIRYELVFYLNRLPGQAYPKEQTLQLLLIKDTGVIKINGSFADYLQIKTLEGLTLANPYLTFDDIASRLDPMLN